MLNPRLNRLPDNPFDRLRKLIDPIKPKDGLEPITLSIGEPRHAPPALIADAFKKNAHLWVRYPPGDGTPEFRRAVTHWLRRRYRLGEAEPERMTDARRRVLEVLRDYGGLSFTLKELSEMAGV